MLGAAWSFVGSNQPMRDDEKLYMKYFIYWAAEFERQFKPPFEQGFEPIHTPYEVLNFSGFRNLYAIA